MDELRSIRFSSRARTTIDRPRERGIALAVAVIIAVLYFGLIELLMIESSRELKAARRFRSHVVAQTLAENAAEGAALMIADPSTPPQRFELEDEQGDMQGTSRRFTGEAGQAMFELTGKAKTAGLEPAEAKVTIRGVISGNKIVIEYADHSL